MSLERWFYLGRMRFRSLLRKGRYERELAKELQFHLEQEIEEERQRGTSDENSRRAALRRLGGISQIQEECRDMRRTNFIENMTRDLRFAFRMLWRTPGFTLVMILTLGLSIGATTAIVSVIDGVLLRSLPYRDPQRLVRVFTKNVNFPKFPVNPNDFKDFRARLHSFESLAAYTRRDLQLAGSGEPVKLSGFSITAGFFRTLGLHPTIGREFDINDELPGKGHVVIISNSLWRDRLGARWDALGRTVVLDGISYTVVGIMPSGVQHPGNMYHAVAYGNTVDIWTPFTSFGDPNQRGSHYMEVIGRLRPLVSAQQAQGEMNSAMAQLAREHPDGDAGWNVFVIPLKSEIVGRSERLLWVLLGAVGLVLLLACVNAANLMLARAIARRREMAVRSALGAVRTRLMRQLLTESVLLAFMGAALGAIVVVAGLKVLLALLPADFPRVGDIHLDAPLFFFTLLVACGTGIVFGIVPALEGSRADLREALHEGGRSTTVSQGTLRLRNGLVVSEVTLACALLLGTGLMLRSFVALLRTNPGFRPEQVMTASISLPSARYKDAQAVTGFYQRLLSELRDVPAITTVGAGSDLPWTGWDDNAGLDIQGEVPPPHQSFHGRYHEATPYYFSALGISVVRGRAFNEHDTATSRKVLVINEAMAKYWKRGDALGGKITFDDHPKEQDWLTVVGIVKDVKDTPKSSSAEPSFWWPMLQEPWPLATDSSLVIRSRLDPQLVADRLRAAVRRLDATLATSDVRTMQHVVDENFSTSQLALTLVSVFASLALLLAMIGTYGVIAYAVNRRVHEFGVRLALGATKWDVLRSVMVSGMKLVLAGTIGGILLGMALSRLLGNLLYGVTTADPLTLATTSLVTILVGAVASYIPALRATRADPIMALRAD